VHTLPHDARAATKDFARKAFSLGKMVSVPGIKDRLRTTAKISSAALATSTTMHAYFINRRSQSHNFNGTIACNNDDDHTIHAARSFIKQSWARFTSYPFGVHSRAKEKALLRRATMRS